jgi:hypothetical protein
LFIVLPYVVSPAGGEGGQEGIREKNGEKNKKQTNKEVTPNPRREEIAT